MRWVFVLVLVLVSFACSSLLVQVAGDSAVGDVVRLVGWEVVVLGTAVVDVVLCGDKGVLYTTEADRVVSVVEDEGKASELVELVDAKDVFEVGLEEVLGELACVLVSVDFTVVEVEDVVGLGDATTLVEEEEDVVDVLKATAGTLAFKPGPLTNTAVQSFAVAFAAVASLSFMKHVPLAANP